MGSPTSNHWQRSVPLNGCTDSSPLKDVVICCTSVPDEKRTQLASFAQEMGALVRLDLTLDVTHLIVGEYDTPKYRYVAKERPDVRPMTMKWIEAVRELWMNDQEIDVDALELEHTLPTLSSLKFSMTGCDDPAQRLEISEKVKANGATYEGDLTKQITHLLSFRTEGAKYKAAKAWGLHLVSVEWLWDSLERGMILDEKLYDPALPPSERGKGAWDRTKPKRRTSLGKRSRDNSVALDGGRRKLRRTASSKLGSQSESMWGDIVGGGSFAQVRRSGIWDTNEPTTPKEPEAGGRPTQASNTKGVEPVADPIRGIFSGCRFYLDGFDLKRSEILNSHLSPHGAEVVATVKELLDSTANDPPLHSFRVIPSDLPVSKHLDLPDSAVQVQTITEWWVERCLHHHRFMNPAEHVIGRPFPKHPIEGFHDMTISSAAFAGIDLLHVKKAVDLVGGIYSEDMTPKSSILITQSVDKLRKDKLDHAQQWGIPIVSATWLWESISAGAWLSPHKYLCQPYRRKESLPAPEMARSKGNPQHGRSKSELTMPISKSDASLPTPTVKLGQSTLDRTAFATSESTIPNPKNLQTDASNSTPETLLSAEPLSEINNNTCASAVSTAPAPTNHPAPAPQADINNAISNLLARTKTSAKPSDETEAEGRKRGTNRILGRAASNISATSTNLSRASSVDSTATHGRPVQYPPYSHASARAEPSESASDQVRRLANASNDRNVEHSDSPPPATQLQYDDPESKEYQEMAMAKMKGEKFDRGDGRKKRAKERSITLGDVAEAAGKTANRGRPRRERAAPGFR